MVEIFYYPVYLYTLTYKPENGTLAFMNKKLDIVKLDCEERFGLASGGCFAAGRFSSLILGLLFTAIFYAALGLLRMHTSSGIAVEMFFPGGAENRTYIPAITVLLAMIALGKLAIKRSKLSMQKYALEHLPEQLNTSGLRAQLAEIYDSPEDFLAPAMLLQQHQAQQTMTNLEVFEFMENSFNDLEKESENGFLPVSTLIWAVPVLGFIGTVLGLARAVGNFGTLLNSGSSGGFEAVLPQITGGLATAFETTLIALVLALILQILSSAANHAEARFIAELKKSISKSTFQQDIL